MKKALITLAAALTVMASIPTMSAQALDPPMKGDLNTDFTVNMADLVLMQRYLLGQCNLDPIYAIYAADVNDDGNADIFDFILMRQMVETADNQITKTFTRCAISLPDGMHYGKQPGQEEAVITSVSELKEYFQPNFVLLTTGECIIIEVASQEVIDDYLARYDKNFFDNNVLCLKFLRGTDRYTYQSVQYDDSSLVIKYYDATDPNLHWTVPLPPYIAEVAVPMNLWADGDVVWEEVEPPFTPSIKEDFISAINDSAIEFAVSDNSPAVIQNTVELESFIDGKFGYGVEKSLKATYTDEYFEENVLILDLYYQGYTNRWQTEVTVNKEYGKIDLMYDKSIEAVGFADSVIKLTQVTVPLEQYHREDVVRVKTWETPIKASHREFDLFSISQISKVDQPFLQIDGLWVSSYEEFESLFKEALVPEIYEIVNFSAENIDWSKQSAYIWVDSNIVESTHKLLSAANGENGLDLKFASKQPLSCMGGDFLHIVTVDKRFEGSNVTTDSINFNNDYPRTGGETKVLPIGDYYSQILIDQYTFGNENTADVYRLFPGGGPSPFNGYQYLGSIDLPEGFYAFSSLEDYTETKNDDGSITASMKNMTVVNYHNSDDESLVKVTFTIPDSGEIIEKTFSY